MTRDEVIQWAMNAGAFLELSTTPEKDITFLMSFAIQVSKHTQEQCAKVCQDRYMGDNTREDMEARRCAEAVMELTV